MYRAVSETEFELSLVSMQKDDSSANPSEDGMQRPFGASMYHGNQELGPSTSRWTWRRPSRTGLALVLAAAGRSTRTPGKLPKQLRILGGIPVIEWSLRTAASLEWLEAVFVMAPPEFLEAVEAIVDPFCQIPRKNAKRKWEVLPGGDTRLETVIAGTTRAADSGMEFVLVHDAARPFASSALFKRVADELLRGADAVVPVIPCNDTLKRCAEGTVEATLDRNTISAAQTPQGLRVNVLKKYVDALGYSPLADSPSSPGQRRKGTASPPSLRLTGAAAADDSRSPTDDVGMAEAIGATVVTVDGEEMNLKLTTPTDFIVAEALVSSGAVAPPSAAGASSLEGDNTRSTSSISSRLRESPRSRENVASNHAQADDVGERPAAGEPRVGTGFDAHRLVPGRPLVLAGVRIPFDKGLQGHSDGDVAAHAVADALAGAGGLGDIGQLFPSSDPTHHNRASTEFLREVADLLEERGLEIAWIDLTVIAEHPVLETFKPAMRDALAASLGIDPRLVSVKATSTDGLGFTGRGEGIAALASCLLRPYRGGSARDPKGRRVARDPDGEEPV